MKNISYSLSIMMALGLLCHAPAQSASALQGGKDPAQQPSKAVKEARKEDKRYNDLVATITTTDINMPAVLITIMAEYALPFLTSPITIYQEKDTEKLLRDLHYRFPQKQYHKYRRPTNILSVAIEYSDPTQMNGHEFRTAVARASGLQQDYFMLQEWSHDDEQYAEDHIISDKTSYPPHELSRYTFGISIPSTRKSAVAEFVASQRKPSTNEPCASYKRTCKNLMIKHATFLYSSLSQLKIQ